jgi:hypothetical protein
MADGDLFTQLVLKRQREIEARSGDAGGPHAVWLPRLVAALGLVVKYGERMAVPHSDRVDAHNYQNTLMNLAAVALAAMPKAKGGPT